MPKLRVLSGRECRAILEANGFSFVHHRGSHMKLERSLENGTLTVIVPDHKEISKSTLSDIIRQSGLPRDLFES